ncbi:MAG: glycosyltransferase family 39 protein [Chloroflexota bacterium]|nr:glycosyltransferase family 39 protein [Chloroflexota bacterium]
MTVADRSGKGPGSSPRSAASRYATTGVWAASALILGLLTVAALRASIEPLGTVFAGPPGTGLILVGVYALIALGLIVTARSAAVKARIPSFGLPLAIVGLTILVRVALAAVADAPLVGENRVIHEQALAVIDGVCCFSHRPPGYPVALAGAYAVFGVGPAAIEILNICFAALTAWLVWDIGRTAWGRPVGAVAATTYAVIPSQVLLTLVPLTEPMYTVLVAGAVRAGIALERRPMVLVAVVCAGLLAASQYVRATAASLVAPLALLPWLVGWSTGRTALRAALIVVVFLVLLLPVVAFNLRAHGDPSISTSAYGGWSLYVGANREHGGGWNAEDAARLAAFPGSSWWERSEYAGSLALDRMLEDPVASLQLLPRKFSTLWGDEKYAAQYALSSGSDTHGIYLGWLASQLFWAPLVALATLGMLAERHRPRSASLLIGMTVTVVAVTHLLLEVHGRYHASVVPLLCVLAAVGADALAARWRARGA